MNTTTTSTSLSVQASNISIGTAQLKAILISATSEMHVHRHVASIRSILRQMEAMLGTMQLTIDALQAANASTSTTNWNGSTESLMAASDVNLLDAPKLAEDLNTLMELSDIVADDASMKQLSETLKNRALQVLSALEVPLSDSRLRDMILQLATLVQQDSAGLCNSTISLTLLDLIHRNVRADPWKFARLFQSHTECIYMIRLLSPSFPAPSARMAKAHSAVGENANPTASWHRWRRLLSALLHYIVLLLESEDTKFEAWIQPILVQSFAYQSPAALTHDVNDLVGMLQHCCIELVEFALAEVHQRAEDIPDRLSDGKVQPTQNSTSCTSILAECSAAVIALRLQRTLKTSTSISDLHNVGCTLWSAFGEHIAAVQHGESIDWKENATATFFHLTEEIMKLAGVESFLNSTDNANTVALLLCLLLERQEQLALEGSTELQHLVLQFSSSAPNMRSTKNLLHCFQASMISLKHFTHSGDQREMDASLLAIVASADDPLTRFVHRKFKLDATNSD